MLKQKIFIRGREQRRENSFDRGRGEREAMAVEARAEAQQQSETSATSSGIVEEKEDIVREQRHTNRLQMAQALEPARGEPNHVRRQTLYYYEEGGVKPVLQTNLTLFSAANRDGERRRRESDPSIRRQVGLLLSEVTKKDAVLLQPATIPASAEVHQGQTVRRKRGNRSLSVETPQKEKKIKINTGETDKVGNSRDDKDITIAMESEMDRGIHGSISEDSVDKTQKMSGRSEEPCKDFSPLDQDNKGEVLATTIPTLPSSIEQNNSSLREEVISESVNSAFVKKPTDLLYTKIFIEGPDEECLVGNDTMAKVNVVGSEFINRHKTSQWWKLLFEQGGGSIKGATGDQAPITGKVNLKLRSSSRTETTLRRSF